MICELRTITLRPGAVKAVADAAHIAIAVRGDDYGKLELCWVTEIGPLNQVMYLWSYADRNERQRLRDELANHERWATEYLPLVRDHIIRHDIRILDPVLPLKVPETEGNIYEYRHYRTAPGRVHAWANLFVPEPLMPRLVIGQAAEVLTDAGDTLSGTVTYVSPQAEFTPRNVQTADERSRLVYRIKVTVDNSAGVLKQGMPVDAELALSGVPAPPTGEGGP